MASSFRPNRAGWRTLMRSQGVQGATDSAAERRAAVARDIAPVKTGRYRASVHAEPDPTANGARSLVVADVDYAIFVEARDNVLGRAIGSPS